MKITKRYLAPLFVVATLVLAGAACGDGGGSVSAFCDTLQKFNEDQSIHVADISEKEYFKRTVKAFKELEANAPSEIKSDMKRLTDMMVTRAELDLTDPEAAQAAAESPDKEKLDAATENFETYANEKCPPMKRERT